MEYSLSLVALAGAIVVGVDHLAPPPAQSEEGSLVHISATSALLLLPPNTPTAPSPEPGQGRAAR